jgi:hypothetical protein
MPGSATSYLRTKVLGHTLAFAAYAEPTAIYLGLCTTATPPTATAPGSEVTGGAYARMAATWAMVVSRTDLAANAATLEWPAATAPWGTLGYAEVWDAATAGNRLYWGPLVDPTDGVTPITRTIAVGDIMRISSGNFTVQAI